MPTYPHNLNYSLNSNTEYASTLNFRTCLQPPSLMSLFKSTILLQENLRSHKRPELETAFFGNQPTVAGFSFHNKYFFLNNSFYSCFLYEAMHIRSVRPFANAVLRFTRHLRIQMSGTQYFTCLQENNFNCSSCLPGVSGL